MRWSRMVNVVKCHVGGEINNVVTGGIGEVPGATVFEKMKFFRDHDDDLRKLLLQPGESVDVSFDLSRADLAFTRADGTHGAEPGAFDVWIAPSSAAGEAAHFELQPG